MAEIASDFEIRKKGLSVLFKNLGEVDAMRFLSQITYEKRDSLKLQEELFEGMTLDEIYKKAEEHFEKNQRKGQTKSVRQIQEFSNKAKEYELVYAGKMRKEDYLKIPVEGLIKGGIFNKIFEQTVVRTLQIKRKTIKLPKKPEIKRIPDYSGKN